MYNAYFKPKIRISYFLDDPLKFPWDIMDLTYPVAGPVHGYICIALAKYEKSPAKEIMLGNPAFFELRRLSGRVGGIPEEIVRYCEGLESRSSGFSNISKQVLDYIGRNQNFKDDFERRIDYLYKNGLILIPDGAKL